MMLYQRVIVLSVLAFAMVLLAACGGETMISEKESVSESGREVIALNGAPMTLNLTSGVGEITIQAGDNPNQVVVAYVKTAYGQTKAEAQAELAAMPLVIGQEAEAITINSVQPALENQTRANTVDLTITVPPAIGLRLVNNVGDVQVRGVQLGEGAAVMVDVGRVRLLDVEALSGLTVSSNVGDVELEGVLGAQGSYEVTTNVGAVTVRVDGALSARVDAETSVGRVTVTGVALRNITRSDGVTAASVRGTAGDGGATLAVRSNIGDVTIRAR
ncbi:MAG: DUF4097 family beta strand repeat-containing protein [Anaerolineae bacterium]|nr:DUF4097 family beta strand repeat-containing protein [Anaerolineae bacterium]